MFIIQINKTLHAYAGPHIILPWGPFHLWLLWVDWARYINISQSNIILTQLAALHSLCLLSLDFKTLISPGLYEF